MKEKIYEIPVNDAFDKPCECPICRMRKKLEDNAVEYTMGPSYMEGDVREMTDKLGFCKEHMNLLLLEKNKLGLAMVLKTHIDKTNKEISKRAKIPLKAPSLFKKSEGGSPVVDYIRNLQTTCFICDRINLSFNRYMRTMIQLWKSDREFRRKFEESQGFCTEHYGQLLEMAQSELRGGDLSEFTEMVTKLYLDNMQRLAEDLEWFCDKFDYQHRDDPWKNSKDAIPRAVIKTNGIIESEDKSGTSLYY
ncbi:MAG: DUF6062 family protein [Lachnospiraceae bacterium]